MRSFTCLFLTIAVMIALPALVLAEEEPEYIVLYSHPAGMLDCVPLPEGALTSYQLPGAGTATYTIYEDLGFWNFTHPNYAPVTISDTGLLTGKSLLSYDDGQTRIQIICTVGENTTSLYFWVIDPSYAYAETELSGFLAANITDGMSDLEKLTRITQHVAVDFDYSGRYSNWRSFAAYGCGDCWSSSYYILEACERLGIEAYVRDGTKNSGAMSGHKNVLAVIDGKLYIAEAGIDGSYRKTMWSVDETPDYSGTYVRDAYEQYAVKLFQYEPGQIDPANLRSLDIPSLWKNQYSAEYYNVVELAARFNAGASETVSVHLPETLQTIGSYAFSNNTSLTEINLPESLLIIDTYAFFRDSNLTDLVLPESLITIGEAAFGNCSGLGTIAIPSKVTSLPRYAFRECGTLTVSIPYSVTEIHAEAFYQTDVTFRVHRWSAAETFAIENDLPYVVTEHISVLPTDLQIIDASAFEGDSLEAVEIQDGVSAIGSRAFADCKQLLWIHIPASVTEIADDAFEGCDELRIIAPAGSAAAAFCDTHSSIWIVP